MEDNQRETRRENDGKQRKIVRPPRRNRPVRNPYRGDDEFNWGKVLRVVLMWSVIILCVFIVMTLFKNTEGEYELSYAQYQNLLHTNQIKDAVIKKSVIDNFDFHGTLKEPVDLVTETGKRAQVEKFFVTLPFVDGTVVADWTAHGVNFRTTKEDSTWMNALFSALPWIIILAAWLIIMRRMQGVGTKGIFSFGKSRAKMINEGAPKVTFADVAGADEAKVELQEIIEFLREPTKFQRLGGKIPRGVLLLGPPGTGKTLLARAVAGEAGVPFFSISGADFVEMFVGVGASRVRD